MDASKWPLPEQRTKWLCSSYTQEARISSSVALTGGEDPKTQHVNSRSLGTATTCNKICSKRKNYSVWQRELHLKLRSSY
ncbi:hypothetical protein Zmor_001639 [Zophobas morio]|uniref:Uncharacterized protein n=1 Tax=Zophobas morio TaxID=2755281 RepID=A0AA38MSZ8_9CUCU|nr:hypothetical protein Zmor_001639 [Zophobas morio]